MLFLLSLSFARDPLLYTGPLAAAVQKVSNGTGIPAWELEPISVEELLTVRQPTVWGVEGHHCTTAIGNSASIGELLALIESNLNYALPIEAKANIAKAEAQLKCLQEPAVASQAGSLYMYKGVTLTLLGEKEGAIVAFKRAIAFVPTMQYDANLPTDGKPFFEAAVASLKKLPPIHLQVAGPKQQLWIDGRVATVSDTGIALAPGEHLLQVLSSPVDTLDIALQADGVLVLPGDQDSSSFTTPNDAWTSLVRGLRPGFQHAFWANENAAWAYSDKGWLTIPKVDLAARQRTAQGLIGSGLSMTVVGGGLLAFSLVNYPTIPASEDPHTATLESLPYYRYANAVQLVAGSTLGAGLFCTAAGIWLDRVHPKPLLLSVAPTEGGAMATVQWTH